MSKGKLLTTVAWAPDPFGAYRGERYTATLPACLTVREIVERVPNRPAGFDRHGYVCVNGEVVDAEQWDTFIPKVVNGVPATVTLHAPAGRGQGGGGGKRIFAIIAAIALIAVTAWITGGGIAAVLGLQGAAFAAGGIGARLLAAGVGMIGSLAIQALSAPPTKGLGEPLNTAAGSVSGNLIGRGLPIPRVVGTYRVFPPLLCQPRVEIDGDDLYVSALWGLAGPHLLDDVRVGGVTLEDAEDVEYETREGWDTDTAITLITEQVYNDPVNLQLSQHKFNDTNLGSGFYELEDQTTPTNSIPTWHRVVTRNTPDKIELHFDFPNGLISDGITGGLPMRIRMRPVGTSTWKNLPEIHWTGNATGAFRKAVVLEWGTLANTAVSGSGPRPRRVYLRTPDQASPVSTGWEAHSHFDAGAGADFLDSSNDGGGGGSELQNVVLEDDRAIFYLSAANFPQGTPYEIEVKRGVVYTEGHLVASTYIYRTFDVYDLCHYHTGAGSDEMIRENEDDVCSVVLSRVISIWDEVPIATAPGLALIAVRARNRSVEQLSVLASGYVKDLASGSPSGWVDWTTTSNPAPHLRDVLVGSLNKRALAEWQVDDDTLVAWRTHCATQGYAVNAILDGSSVADALMLIASCGYGRVFKSEKWGIAYDRDRTGETPIQIFSPRNARNFRWGKAFPDLPDHFLVTYRSAADDYEEREVVVYAPGYTVANATLAERVGYVGLVTEAEVEERATYDQSVARERAAIYTLEAWVENIVCRRGDLVGVQHDTLAKQVGAARIKSVTKSGSPTLITGLVLDGIVPMNLDEDGVADPTRLYGVAIRYRDGTIETRMLEYAGDTTDTLTFAIPFADPGDVLAEDCLVTVGPAVTVYERFIVLDIEPQSQFVALLRLVDEAPSLFGVQMAAASASIVITATAAATEADEAGAGAATIAITASAAATGTKAGAAAAAVAITAAAAATATKAGAGSASIAITTTADATEAGAFDGGFDSGFD